MKDGTQQQRGIKQRRRISASFLNICIEVAVRVEDSIPGHRWVKRVLAGQNRQSNLT